MQKNNVSGPAVNTREQALSILERGDRTELQLRRKLLEKGCPADETEETISFLKEYRYIDDAEYARRYVRSYASRKSVRQIREALEQRGVAAAWIAEAIQEQPVDEERQIRAILLKRNYTPGEHMDPREHKRLMGALTRRGFSYDSIHKVMERMERMLEET